MINPDTNTGFDTGFDTGNSSEAIRPEGQKAAPAGDKNIAPAMRFTFPKSERLRHKVLVDSLFAKGNSIYEYPFRLTWRPLSQEELEEAFKIAVPDKIAPLQVMITVPKKKRRHAVDRVLMRRRIRDAWRLQRRQLRRIIGDNPELRTVSVAVIYISNDNIDSAKLRYKLSKLISKLSSSLSSKPS